MNITLQTNKNPPANPSVNPTSSSRERAEGITLNAIKENPSASLIFEAVNSQVQMIKRLTAETIADAWEELENWRPSENKTAAENVQALKDLYLSMKNYILNEVDKALQEQQLAKLESLVLKHVETLLNGSYGELTEFVVNNHQESAVFAIKNSLLFFIQGKLSQEYPVWPEEFFQQGKNQNTAPTQKESAIAKRSAENGMLQYGPGHKTNFRMIRMKSAELQALPVTDQARTSFTGGQSNAKTAAPSPGVVMAYMTKDDALQSLFPKPFTLLELEKSNLFARHMNQFSRAVVLTAESVEKEEWIGIRSGIAWLKGQSFSGVAGVSKNMSLVMQNAVENQIFTSMRQASAALKNEAGIDPQNTQYLQRFAPLEQAAVFSTYNYVVRNFTKSNDAKSTILNSIFYMIDILKKKEEDPAFQSILRYQDGSEKRGGTKPEMANGYMNENKSWFQQIKNSWNQFIKDMNLRSDASVDFSRFEEQYSIWACALTPSPSPGQDQTPEPSFMTTLGWCIVGVSAVLLILFLLTVDSISRPTIFICAGICFSLFSLLAVKLLLAKR